MPNVYKVKSKRWAGSVTFSDPLTLPQAEAIEACSESLDTALNGTGTTVKFTLLDKPRLQAVFACVEKWNLADMPEGVTFETFPFSPRKAAHLLIEELWARLLDIYIGERDIPNE